ncbi:MAG: 3-oxoacyl-[acyl-carrier-protein] reductase [Caldisericia bacterium]|nr:3-oxoacyl-[acyl-carrier-protein] reductase [Caldisericia bacterium]MDD4614926.1 3-oxoacyl-[acyl-carrier-protein] reductase [Caldisericia bacterium]
MAVTKSVLITGASRGIGQQIAVQFAKQGAFIAINYPFESEKENAMQTLHEVQNRGSQGQIYEADVSNLAAVEDMVKKVKMDAGSIDVLVANAGITKDKLIMRMTSEDWNQVLQINLTGAFHCTKAVTKEMMQAKKGRIVYISSVIGMIGNAGQANYAASKGGMIALCKSVAKEFGSRNITANCVAPGYILTEMTQNLPKEATDQFMSRVSIKRFGTMEDIAHAVLFLSSDQAAYITGQVLVVDGGLTL